MRQLNDMLPDISTRQDLEWIVSTFYQQLLRDDVVKVFFTEVVPIDLAEHLPVIVDFWQSALLAQGNYKGNPMIKHIEMSRKMQLERVHLETWLRHWEDTIRRRYAGPTAEVAITRARSIGEMILFKTAPR